MTQLKTLESDLNPDSITCDFEFAAFTALKDAFTNVQIFGYLWTSYYFFDRYIVYSICILIYNYLFK